MTPTPAKVDTAIVVKESLQLAAMYKRPHVAIAAFATLIALGAFDVAHRGPWQRLIELSWKGRPAVAAASARSRQHVETTANPVFSATLVAF